MGDAEGHRFGVGPAVAQFWGVRGRAQHVRVFKEVFKARLDGALSTLVWWMMSLLMAGALEPDDL